ncbi:hypothetical protein G3A43_07325 [Paraburkholderia aspalathi]|nr:hypothetical protein [Paraburkholderia aspalathi]MBK3780064.1 hypothetical protein [Paraburkholderia aspalathi]
MTNVRAVRSGVDVVGSAVGRWVSLFLAAGNRVVGGVVSRVLSSRAQRLWFIAVTRGNALVVVLGAAVSLKVAGWLFPYSGLVPALTLLASLLPMGMWLRLAPKASFLVSSLYGRQLRVHLPDTSLTVRDVASFKQQTESLIRIAQLTRAKTLHFDSPLLVAGSTRQHLRRYLESAASRHGANITIDVGDAREVDAVAQGSLSVHAERYDVLRGGRISTGPNGRLLTCKVLVRMHYA